MLGIVELIFSIVGIYGFFTENLIWLITGLIITIICDLVDIFVCGHNPTTILLSCVLAIGVSIVNKNPLYSFTITLCGENLIMSIITLLIVVIGMATGIIKSKLKKDNDVMKKEKVQMTNNQKLIIFILILGSIFTYLGMESKKKIDNLYIEIDNLEKQKQKISTEYINLNSKYETAKNKIEFMDNYVVLIPYNTKTYHKYDCEYCNKNNGGSILHNEEAIEKGYRPCKYCIKQ